MATHVRRRNLPGGHLSDAHAQACSGSSATTTAPVAATGGTVQLEDVTVTFPTGAFTTATNATVTSTTDSPPSGLAAYSPVYQFGPDGAQFVAPVNVTFVVGTAVQHPTIFWSRPGGGWQNIGGSYVNGEYTTTVTHLSEGFVAESPCAGHGEGAACEDGDACTQSETCQGGACQAPTQYPVIRNLPVDSLGTAGGDSFADAINNLGQAVGDSTSSSGQDDAVLFQPPQSPLDLGVAGEALGINDFGVVTGDMLEADGSHVFRYTNGAIEDLGVGGDDSVVPDYYDFQGAGDGINNRAKSSA